MVVVFGDLLKCARRDSKKIYLRRATVRMLSGPVKFNSFSLVASSEGSD